LVFFLILNLRFRYCVELKKSITLSAIKIMLIQDYFLPTMLFWFGLLGYYVPMCLFRYVCNYALTGNNTTNVFKIPEIRIINRINT
jgi:hypothetical protein